MINCTNNTNNDINMNNNGSISSGLLSNLLEVPSFSRRSRRASVGRSGIWIYIAMILNTSISIVRSIAIIISITMHTLGRSLPGHCGRTTIWHIRVRRVFSQSYISKGIWRQGIGSFVRNSNLSTLCPVVICPYVCTSDFHGEWACSAARGAEGAGSLGPCIVYHSVIYQLHICYVV